MAFRNNRFGNLHQRDDGVATLEGVGLAFVGVTVLAAGVWISTATRNNAAEHANTAQQLNYKAGPPPAKSGAAMDTAPQSNSGGSGSTGSGSGGSGGGSGGNSGGGGGGGSGGGGGGGTPLPEAEKLPYRMVATAGDPPVDDPKTPVDESLYETEIKIYVNSPEGEKELITVRATTRPDDKSKHGSINAGTYSLHLGFHKRQGNVPTADDLIVKSGSEKLRPALIVNKDASVDCTSDDPKKTTMSAIHVHNGFKTERGSEGCITIHPDDWSKLIKTFLDAYPTLEDWYQAKPAQYYVKEIGKLEIVRPAAKK